MNQPELLCYQLTDVAAKHNLKVHMDGARLFNAATALGVPVAQVTKYVDSVTFCLSKVTIYSVVLFCINFLNTRFDCSTVITIFCLLEVMKCSFYSALLQLYCTLQCLI